MARKRKGLPVHGWLIFDKPAGMTSTSAVGLARRLFEAQKAGHGGTLDPFATGILPIAFGEATKTVSYVMDGDKEYRFTIRWGAETDSCDPEGKVVAESDVRPDRAAIEAVLGRFTGSIEQIPPIYSAIKIDGERAYDLARAGEVPEMKPRQVEIFELQLVDCPDQDHAVLDAVCGKGTYVRALARDIARALGTVGHVEQLRRIAVGPFGEDDAISLDGLEELGNKQPDQRQEALFAVEAALDGIPAVDLTEAEAMRLRNGQAVSFLRKMDLERIGTLAEGDVVLAMADGRPLALSVFERGEMRPVRVLNI